MVDPYVCLFNKKTSHHDREVPRRTEPAVFRERRLYVYGDQQVCHRIEHQHPHDVGDAHLVVRRHGHLDVFPSQSGANALEHDQTLEYVTQRRVR